MRSNFRGRTWLDKDHDISPEQTEFATELRIPFLTTAYPRWNYITGIVVGLGPASELSLPTHEEVALVDGFLKEYKSRYYPSYVQDMEQFAPYDIDGGANAVYFMKHTHHGGWSYRVRSWTIGPSWMPGMNQPPRPSSRSSNAPALDET